MMDCEARKKQYRRYNGGKRMTRRELSQLYYLNKEIEQDKRRLLEFETYATSTSSRITGLPHSTDLSDKTALAAEIADIRNAIEAKIRLSVVEYNRLTRYINTIEDSFIRQIMILRNINGLSWIKIAMQIGGGNTDKSVSKAYYRFLGKEK